MNSSLPLRLLAAGALLAFMALTALAQAQYLWIDEKGLKVYSDRPPPPSTPLKNILKAPRGTDSAASVQAEQDAAGPTSAPVPDTDAAKPKAAPGLAERNADYLKRSKDKAEREQKDQDAQQTRLEQAENCERARAARQALDSGVRIGTQEKNGERGFMSDAQRTIEGQKIDKLLAACK